MTTLAKKYALLADLYVNHTNSFLQESEEISSFFNENILILAICFAITNELVDINPNTENLIERTFGDFAELLGTDVDYLASKDSIGDIFSFGGEV